MARFFYDNMALVRYVRRCEVLRSGLDGATQGHRRHRRQRPNIERHIIGEPRADLDDTLNQDVDLVEAVQRGQKSRGFRGPLWSQQESRIRHCQREIDRYIDGEQ